jgi:hypothetical protein
VCVGVSKSLAKLPLVVTVTSLLIYKKNENENYEDKTKSELGCLLHITRLQRLGGGEGGGLPSQPIIVILKNDSRKLMVLSVLRFILLPQNRFLEWLLTR